jgi:hypothetical protein
MGHQVRFNPDQGWEAATIFVGGRRVQAHQQRVYHQLDSDEWITVLIQRPAAGFHRNPHVKEAHLVRGLRPGGRFDETHYIDPNRITIEADATAPESTAPTPPAERHTAAHDYIARAPYAVPKPAADAEPPWRHNRH